MNIPHEAIEEFKALHKKKYDVDLTDIEAYAIVAVISVWSECIFLIIEL